MNNALFAKLLSRENLTLLEDPTFQTASFDTQQRVLRLPMWTGISEETKNMFIAHEVAHALWSDDNLTKYMLDNMHRPAFKSYLNVVEDCRIDRMIKNEFPGIRRDYAVGNEELLSRDFYGVNEDHSDLKLIDRINLLFKTGIAYSLKFSDQEQVIVDKIKTISTVDEVISVAEELYALAKQQAQQEKQEQPKSGKSEDQKEETNTESADSDSEQDSDESENTELTETDLDSDTYNAEKTSQDKLIQQDNSNSIQLEFQYDFHENKIENHVMTLKDTLSLINPSDYDKIIPLMTDRFKEINRSVDILVKEFEMKKSATQFKKELVAKSGKLNVKKLYAHNIRDDIFSTITEVTNENNHSIFFLMDWSASMLKDDAAGKTCLHSTMKNLMIFMVFCKRVDIPFEVYTYTSFNTPRDISTYTGIRMSSNSDYLIIRNLFSSSMTIKQIQQLYTVIQYKRYFVNSRYNAPINNESHISINKSSKLNCGATPTHAAFSTIRSILDKFIAVNKSRKIIFTHMTDGTPDHPYSRTKQSNLIISNKKLRYSETVKNEKAKISNLLLKQFRTEYKNLIFFGFYVIVKDSYSCRGSQIIHEYDKKISYDDAHKMNNKMWSEMTPVELDIKELYDHFYLIPFFNPFKEVDFSEISSKSNVKTISQTLIKIQKHFKQNSDLMRCFATALA